MSTDFIPRFRGNAIEVEGGFIYEIYVSILGGGDICEAFRSHDTYPDKQTAIDAMKKEVQFMIQSLAKGNPEFGICTENYIDMNSNEILKWNRSKHN